MKRTPRVMQIEGLFDVPPAERSGMTWDVDLPLDEREWSIGLIVGPSGSGKSTVAREVFPDAHRGVFDWPPDDAVVDAFPTSMGVKAITSLLSSVGFSSPPAWLRPYHALSTGEQFRVALARTIAEAPGVAVIDEFTSVVDRTVARIGSAAVAKAVRRSKRQLVAVACHYDILDWLQPDWTYQPHVNEFTWRSLQPRPGIDLTLRRVDSGAWRIFAHHHYLSTDLNRSAHCYVATIAAGDPVAFAAVIAFPHARRPGWREHRLVCLPDYQGVGIGNRVSEYVASLYRGTSRPYFSVTGNPAMVYYRARSPRWRMTRSLGRTAALGRTSGKRGKYGLEATLATNRNTAGFEYVGPPADLDDARAFGITRE